MCYNVLDCAVLCGFGCDEKSGVRDVLVMRVGRGRGRGRVRVQSCQAKLCERTKRGCLWTASAVVNEWQARSGAILWKGKCRPVW